MSAPAPRRDSAPTPIPGPAPEPLRLVSLDEAGLLLARREHRMRSLMELSRELMTMRDLFGTIDLLLFSLMGQFGAARACLWLRSEEKTHCVVLVRSLGVQRTALPSATPELDQLVVLLKEQARPILLSADTDVPAELREQFQQAGMALVAPLIGQGEVVGMFALGGRVSGQIYDDEELSMLTAALGILGLALQNTLLFHRQGDLNQQLQRMNDHLVELDRMKSQFVANVNHELRTPLAVVIGSLQCMVEPIADTARFQGLVQGALSKAQELASIVERLLLYSQLDGRRTAAEVRPGDVAAALTAYHEQRVPGIHAGLREFMLVCDPALPRAWFDLKSFLQILDELINNAIKFTTHGSRLELRAWAESRDDRHWVVVQVSDNGPGIPREKLGTLFKEFEQGDGSATRTVGGLGLGLPLARKLAGTMGARLEVDMQVTTGAAFVILLPAA